MFERILVANRGEIAVRIIRACREMGIETVAVYSEADRDALHTQLADIAVCIGPAKAKDSYLNMKNIISAAVATKAEAIHPGFGFLSENSKFSSMCEAHGITFIGPDGDMIDRMGNKSEARKTMVAAGVTVVPGSDGALDSVESGLELARKIGYPVLIKASAGGGGKGMRVVYSDEEFIKGYESAKQESKNAFGDDAVYLEKYVLEPKHIEFQILADNYGHVLHLGERDCSMQRRHQKILEESPSPIMTPELRAKMGSEAVKAAKCINYRNAGTIEFIVDKDGNYYFIEMNTRIQVEHPITEMVTGMDLIKEQIRIAAGEPLTLTQEDVTFEGHSIECRINAENPSLDFRPSPGKITHLHLPGGKGVRIDSSVYCGYSVSPVYDSMIAKLIVHDKSRDLAIKKMRSALGELVVQGIDTNIDLQYDILHHDAFVQGKYDTSFVGKYIDEKYKS